MLFQLILCEDITSYLRKMLLYPADEIIHVSSLVCAIASNAANVLFSESLLPEL